MAELPSATVSIDDEAGAQAGGTDLVAVFACVAQNDDIVPRVFANSKAILTKHAYSQGADYCASHFDETKKPVVFVPLPIVTAGTIGRLDASGNTGSSVVTVAAGSGGVLDEVDFVGEVVSGGDIGTDQIVLSLSFDGGRTFKSARLGTEVSYTVPYYGFVLSFAAGDLNDGDTFYKFSTTAPRWDQAGLQAGREALAAQQVQVRSFLVVGDCVEEDDADDIVTEVNAYETANDRFVYARASVRDIRHHAAMSRLQVRMSGTPTITFTEVGVSADTITRSAGSFIADGFVAGDIITVSGAVASAGVNNVTGAIASLTDTVLTLGSTDLLNEGPITGVTIVASGALTFAEVGTDDTITRTRGSWIEDGFAVGDIFEVQGTSLNNVSGPIKTLTATVLTTDAIDLAAEVLPSFSVTVTAGEEDADWVTSINGEFGDVDDQRRIDLSAGRARKLSKITGYRLRRPASWALSLREYQHDVHIPTYRKADGPLDGWDFEDAEGNKAEHDERVDGGLLLARFSCLTTFANGPLGVFAALSLTRALDGALLSRTHNMAIANVASSICQAETENAIGYIVETNDDGTGTDASLTALEKRVDSALAMGLLQSKGEGKRATDVHWKASRTDDLSQPGNVLTGVCDLRIGKTIEQIATSVVVS